MATESAVDLVVAALDKAGEHRAARGLEACERMARSIFPKRGLLLSHPDDPDGATYEAIDRIAERHFGMAARKRKLKRCLAVVKDVSARNEIIDAIGDLRAASDDAHYYAGMAMGLTASAFGLPRSKAGARRRS